MENDSSGGRRAPLTRRGLTNGPKVTGESTKMKTLAMSECEYCSCKIAGMLKSLVRLFKLLLEPTM